MPEENLSGVVVDLRDEPEGIPFDVEHGKFAHSIRGGKHLPDLHQATPPRLFGDAIPNVQRASEIRVHVCGLQKLLAADDVQGRPRHYWIRNLRICQEKVRNLRFGRGGQELRKNGSEDPPLQTAKMAG